MVSIGGKPIIWHIMDRYSKFGFKEFIIALGYKSEVVKQYFLNYTSLNSDFTIELSSGKISEMSVSAPDWKVTLVDTGIETMTGGRLKRLQSFIGKDPFMLTYGDGVADIDIGSLVDFHKKHGKLATVSAVRPAARFGELEITDSQVTSFREKPQLEQGWINGGYFVFEPEFIDMIAGDSTLLEREPLESAALQGELMAYLHQGFWQSMDTKREHQLLEKMWSEGRAPWAH
jgi:glucose-1-phosphate cytidylyltransferase